jgi:hypothetical protein
VAMKISIFWDVTLCSALKDNRCFGGGSGGSEEFYLLGCNAL